MAKKRKPLSQKIRFEVFKRDMFTCQYCGGKAPDAILEVDHIVPVAKNGDNSLENLVTACKECNRGKRDKKLDDVSEVEKSRRQIEEMQERNNMIEMIFKWRESVRESETQAIEKLNSVFYDCTGYTFTERYKNRLHLEMKKIGLEILLESLYIAIDTYFEARKPQMPIEEILLKWLGIAHNKFNQENNPKKSSINKIKNFAIRNYGIDSGYFYRNFPIEDYRVEDEEEVKTMLMEKDYVSHFWDALRIYYGR